MHLSVPVEQLSELDETKDVNLLKPGWI